MKTIRSLFSELIGRLLEQNQIGFAREITQIALRYQNEKQNVVSRSDETRPFAKPQKIIKREENFFPSDPAVFSVGKKTSNLNCQKCNTVLLRVVNRFGDTRMGLYYCPKCKKKKTKVL